MPLPPLKILKSYRSALSTIAQKSAENNLFATIKYHKSSHSVVMKPTHQDA